MFWVLCTKICLIYDFLYSPNSVFSRGCVRGSVVGGSVVGASVVGGSVVGCSVVGGTVVGDSVVGGFGGLVGGSAKEKYT